jgi:endonuclease YncB( thermonuclease family)
MLTLRSVFSVLVPVAFALVTGLLSGLSPATAARSRVLDGDTIHVGDTRVRLEGIDAPENAQTCSRANGESWPCGHAATKALQTMVEGRLVVCRNLGLEKYGRTLATCSIDSVNINAEMVRRGLAWAFVRYSSTYVALEAEARAAQLGIWQGLTQPAWDYRAEAWTARAEAAPNGCAIKGNVTASGHIYHMPWSPWYDRVRITGHANKRWFCSEAEAIEAGWRPAFVRRWTGRADRAALPSVQASGALEE